MATAESRRSLLPGRVLDEPGFRLRQTESLVVLVLAAFTYLAAGGYLNLYLHLNFGDATTRLASAYYVFFSRDPHLGAIGFIWNPLPSISVMPLLPLGLLWRPLIAEGLASTVASAFFMAGACYQLYRAMLQLRLNVVARMGLLLAFALHPLNLIAGGEGMSEAWELFFVLATVRYLLRWIEDRSLGAQVMTGLFLAGALLSRPEAPVLAGGTIAVIAVVSYLDARRAQDRLWIAANDVAIVAAPAALAFGSWLLAALLLTGELFPFQQSIYGHASQTAILHAYPYFRDWFQGGAGYRLHRMIGIVFYLEPAFALTMVAGLITLARIPRRSLAVLATVGALIAYVALATLRADFVISIRYYIITIPLLVLVAAMTVASWPRSLAVWRRIQVPLTMLIIGAQLLALPVSAIAMSRGDLEPSSDQPGQAFGAPEAQPFSDEATIARYLDRLHMPDGSVLTDTWDSWPVILQSQHPRQFIITSDRDFSSALRDPAQHRVRYFLVPDPYGVDRLDAINRVYPSMYGTGAGLAVLVRTFPGSWRLYRLRV